MPVKFQIALPSTISISFVMFATLNLTVPVASLFKVAEAIRSS